MMENIAQHSLQITIYSIVIMPTSPYEEEEPSNLLDGTPAGFRRTTITAKSMNL